MGSAQSLRHEREADGTVRRRMESNGNVTATGHRARGVSVNHMLNRAAYDHEIQLHDANL